jgi:hypothetical protein
MATHNTNGDAVMNEHRAPSPDELNAYVTLIRFLRQVHSLMQDINEEAERFHGLLDQQCVVLDRHRLNIEDLTSALSDYRGRDGTGQGNCPARATTQPIIRPPRPTQG